MTTSLTVDSHPDIEQGIPRRSSVAGADSGEANPEFSGEAVVGSVVNDEERRSSSCCSSSSCVSVSETKVSVHLAKVERDCRICHLSLDGSNPDSGYPIDLGCSCKDDLAAAHKHCAETWFKIRGNKVCEICGSTARNVVGMNDLASMEQWNEANEATMTVTRSSPADTRHFWQGHRFLNFLLACMVFAFVISWLFHFNVPS